MHGNLNIDALLAGKPEFERESFQFDVCNGNNKVGFCTNTGLYFVPYE